MPFSGTIRQLPLPHFDFWASPAHLAGRCPLSLLRIQVSELKERNRRCLFVKYIWRENRIY